MASGKIETIITGKDTSGSAFNSLSASLIGLNQGLQLLDTVMGALTAPFTAVVDEGRAFTAQMSAVEAISKTTASEFEKLTAEAKRIGETTAFSATQAGGAMEELRRAGLNVTDTLNTAAQAMDLAAATGSDLATAARVTAIQMKIFEQDSLDAKTAVDLMVQTVGASPQDFSDLTSALETAGGTASAMGIDFGELTGIIGAMANAGVRGEKAGTALNGAIARLLNPAKSASDVLAKYGISLDQVNPTTQKFADILDTLKDAEIEQKDLLTLLGQEAGPKFFKVIDAGGDSIRDFTKAQKEANTASEAASIRLDNLEGDITLFDSAMSGVKLSVFETFEDVLRGVVQQSTAMASAFTAFLRENEGPMTAFFEAVKEKIDAVKEVSAALIRGFGFLLEAFGQIISSDPVIEFIDRLEAAFRKIYTEGIEPLIGNIQDFIDIVVETVLSNEKLSGILGKVFTAMGLVVDILGVAYTAMVKALSEVVKLSGDGFGPFFDILVDVADILIDGIVWALEKVKFAVENVGEVVGIVTGVWDSFVELIDETTATINAAINTTIETWDLLVGKFNDALEVIQEVKTFLGDMGGEISGKLKAGFKIGADALADFTREVIGADEAGKDLSMTLVGNTMSVDAGVVGAAFIEAGRDLQTYGLDVKDADAESKKLNRTIVDTAGNLNDTTTAAENAAKAIFDLSTETGFFGGFEIEEPADGPAEPGVGDAAAGFGMRLAGQVTGVSGAISGFQTGGIAGAIAGFAADILFSNEEFKAVMGELNEAIAEAFAPLITELVPIIRALIPIIRTLSPLIERLSPAIAKATEAIVFLTGRVDAFLLFWISVGEDLAEKLGVLRDSLDGLREWTESLQNSIEIFFDRLPFLTESINGLKEFFTNLEDALRSLEEPIKELADKLGLGGGGPVGDIIGQTTTALGFASGSDGLTQDQLLRLPGMEVGSGLVKAHVGEAITPTGQSGVGSPVSITMNVKSINPREQTNEIRQLLEELFLSGRLRVS